MNLVEKEIKELSLGQKLSDDDYYDLLKNTGAKVENSHINSREIVLNGNRYFLGWESKCKRLNIPTAGWRVWQIKPAKEGQEL